MPLIIVPYPVPMSSLTQAEETIIASTLVGQPDGSSTIWNNTILGIRRWDGTSFVTVPQIPSTILPPSGGSVPYFIPSGTTFSTTQYQQSLASIYIDCEGVIDVSNGVLVFVP